MRTCESDFFLGETNDAVRIELWIRRKISPPHVPSNSGRGASLVG